MGRVYMGSAVVAHGVVYTLFVCVGVPTAPRHMLAGKNDKGIGTMRNHRGPRAEPPDTGRCETRIAKPPFTRVWPARMPNTLDRFFGSRDVLTIGACPWDTSGIPQKAYIGWPYVD